jgi:hypothetical protein
MHEFLCAKREAGLSGWRRVGVDEICVCRKVVTLHINVSFVANFTPHIQQVFIALHIFIYAVIYIYKYSFASQCRIAHFFVCNMEIYASVSLVTFYDDRNMNKICYNLHYSDNIYLIRDGAVNCLSIELIKETTPTAHILRYVYGTRRFSTMFMKILK